MNCKKIIYNIKENINYKDIIFFFIISIIFFGIFINLEYATDTYTVFTAGAKQDIIHFLGSGRFVTAFSTAVARIIHLSELQIYTISYIIAIISLVLSLYEMNKIIKKDVESKIISKIISILIILNVFIIELFLFIEKGILVFSILLNVYAIKYLIKYFETKNKIELIKVLALMFFANGAYQGTVGLFIAIATIYIIKYSKNIKDFIVNNIITGICYVIPAVLDLIIARIFDGDRVSGQIMLMESIQKVLLGTKNMMKTYFLIPEYIFIMFFIVVIGILIYKIIRSKKNTKIKIINMLSIVYIILGTLVATILPQLMQDTESIWMVPRSTYAFASLIGLLILYLCMNFKDVNLKSKPNKKTKIKTINYCSFIVLISVIYILIEYVNVTKVEVDRYKLNQEDKQVSIQIIDKVKEYENNTGNKIDSIAIYQDKNMQYTYKDIFVTGDINVKAYSSNWATKSIIEYYGKFKLNSVEQDEKIAAEFAEKNWDYFNDEQLIFKENTLHICCY